LNRLKRSGLRPVAGRLHLRIVDLFVGDAADHVHNLLGGFCGIACAV
jgi:hypothetical protein